VNDQKLYERIEELKLACIEAGRQTNSEPYSLENALQKKTWMIRAERELMDYIEQAYRSRKAVSHHLGEE